MDVGGAWVGVELGSEHMIQQDRARVIKVHSFLVFLAGVGASAAQQHVEEWHPTILDSLKLITIGMRVE